MLSSKVVVAALCLGVVTASSTLLSLIREQCSETSLSECRGTDQSYWYDGCMSCAGANLSGDYVERHMQWVQWATR